MEGVRAAVARMAAARRGRRGRPRARGLGGGKGCAEGGGGERVEEADVEVARTEEATSATARAAAVWAAARVVISVAEVMVLVGMAAMRVAAVAAFKRCTLSADAPIDAPPKGIAKEVSRRHRRVTTAVGEKRHCCGTRQIANRGGGEEGRR